MQQNLNHWYYPTPGHLDASIACGPNPSDDDFTVLAIIPDAPMHDQVWQTNYTLPVYLPDTITAKTQCTIRVRYVAYNPDEKAPSPNVNSTFYNCASVTIDPQAQIEPSQALQRHQVEAIRQASKASALAAAGFEVLPTPAANPTGCRTPDQFEATSIEAREKGNLVRTYAYDATNLRVYIKRSGPISVDANIISETTWTTYDNRNQYVLFEYADGSDPVCELYGADGFYAWANGEEKESAGQFFAYQVSDGNILANVWSNNHTFEWATSSDLCLPVWRMEIDSAFSSPMELFTSASKGISDPSIFDVPAICTKSVKQYRCRD